MQFGTNNSNVTETRYTYTTDDENTAEPAHIVSGSGMISINTKPYLVGLSTKKNVPLKTLAAVSRFKSKPIDVNGVEEYYWELK